MKRATRAIAVAAIVIAPSVARAQPDPAKVEAERRFEEGLTEYQQKDYEGARLKFTEAYAVLNSVDILYNLCASEVRSGHALEGIVHLRQLLRDPRSTDVDRVKAQKLLAEANSHTGHIQVEAPDGAVILLDMVPAGDAPLKEALDVKPGRHTVQARMGDKTRSIEVSVPMGEMLTARFAIDAVAPPTATAPQPIATAEEPSSAPRTREEPPARSGARIVVPVVLGAAAVAATTVGLVFALDSRSKRDEVDAYRDGQPGGFCFDRGSAACGAYEARLDEQQQSATLSKVFYVAGGVLAVSAVATFVLWKPAARPQNQGAARNAWIAPGPGGVRVGGTF
jgi:hypothetical protein